MTVNPDDVGEPAGCVGRERIGAGADHERHSGTHGRQNRHALALSGNERGERDVKLAERCLLFDRPVTGVQRLQKLARLSRRELEVSDGLLEGSALDLGGDPVGERVRRFRDDEAAAKLLDEEPGAIRRDAPGAIREGEANWRWHGRRGEHTPGVRERRDWWSSPGPAVALC